MKNVINVKWEDDVVRFDCPFCGVDAEVDEGTLREVWAENEKGTIACPGPDGCLLEYILPTLEELEVLKSAAPKTPDKPAPTPLVLPAQTPAVAKPAPATALAGPTVQMGATRKQTVTIGRPNGARMKVAIRTFRHMDYKQAGQDHFDQSVSDFLEQIGTENIVSISPINYMDRDDKLVDYGVLVVHRKPIAAAAAPEPATASAPAGKTEWRD